jgi:hypothetical protein
MNRQPTCGFMRMLPRLMKAPLPSKSGKAKVFSSRMRIRRGPPPLNEQSQCPSGELVARKKNGGALEPGMQFGRDAVPQQALATGVVPHATRFASAAAVPFRRD